MNLYYFENGKAVHHQLYTFLKENDLLAPEQFGFRPNLSTEVALAHLTENIPDNVDNGLITGDVFLDLSKAFDTVNHQILLKKLHCSCLNNNSMEWLKFYLSDRVQVTSIGNCLSSSSSVTVEVPQESILGPLLFIIYVNDLRRCLKYCKIILYADDTLIYYSAKSTQDVQILNLLRFGYSQIFLLLTVSNQDFYYLGVNAVRSR